MIRVRAKDYDRDWRQFWYNGVWETGLGRMGLSPYGLNHRLHAWLHEFGCMT